MILGLKIIAKGLPAACGIAAVSMNSVNKAKCDSELFNLKIQDSLPPLPAHYFFLPGANKINSLLQQNTDSTSIENHVEEAFKEFPF